MPAIIFMISFSDAWLIIFKSNAILILRLFWWARPWPAYFNRMTSFVRNLKDASFFSAFEPWIVSFLVHGGTVHAAKFLHNIFIILSCLIDTVQSSAVLIFCRFWWAWKMFFGQHDSVFRAHIPNTGFKNKTFNFTPPCPFQSLFKSRIQIK